MHSDNLYERLFELHGADLASSNPLTPTFDQRDDRVKRIIEEGHLQRLYEAARRWNLEVRESLGDDNAKGIGVPETRFHWQFNPNAMCNTTPSGAPSKNCEAPPRHSRHGPSRERLQSGRARTSEVVPLFRTSA